MSRCCEAVARHYILITLVVVFSWCLCLRAHVRTLLRSCCVVAKRLMMPLLRNGCEKRQASFRAERITETDGPNLREDSVRFRRLLFVGSVASGCVFWGNKGLKPFLNCGLPSAGRAKICLAVKEEQTRTQDNTRYWFAPVVRHAAGRIHYVSSVP